MKKAAVLMILALQGFQLFAQTPAASDSVLTNPGVMITITLILIVLVIAVYLVAIKVNNLVKTVRERRIRREAKYLAKSLQDLSTGEVREELIKRKQALDFKLSNTELSGENAPDDKKGLLHNIAEVNTPRFIAAKKKAVKRPDIDPELTKLILWYLGSATFWLVLGTSVGEYLGIKFVAPDVDHVSWLSFGRLRPVHTNMVFWGWSSLAMIGLGYYVVSTVSNTVVASLKRGWYGL